MIIFINFSGGRVAWREAALFVLLSYLLRGGIDHLLSTTTYLTSALTGDSGSPLTLLLDLLLVSGMLALCYGCWVLLAPTRAGQLLRQLLLRLGGAGAAAAGAQGARPRGTTGHNQTAQQRQQRWDKVVRTLQQLPTDVVATRCELEQETTQQLKQRLAAAGLSCDGVLEKRELVDKVLNIGGSSASSCSICCEDYVSGDVVRVLPCTHKFHIPCVDRWFLSAAADYSRSPSCPMCNTELQLQ